MNKKVTYGGNTYEQAGLGFSDLLKFGTVIQPKLAGIITTIGAIQSESTVVSSEVYSFYQSVESIFNPEEWEYLFRLFLMNEENLLLIDGVALTTDAIEEHFRGDLLRAFTVAWGLARQNMGKFENFIQSLPESLRKTAASFKEVFAEKIEGLKPQDALKGTSKKK